MFSKYKFQLLSSIFLCPIDPLLQTFQKIFQENNFLWKKCSEKRIFIFFLRNAVLPLIKMSKKLLYRNTQRKNYFSQNMFFLFSVLCSPIDESYKTSQIFLRKTNFSEKNFFSKLISLLFYHRSSVSTLITMSFEKSFMENGFHKKQLFWKKAFFQRSCVIPLVNFTGPFKKLFS